MNIFWGCHHVGYHLYVQLTSGQKPDGWNFFRKYLLWGKKVLLKTFLFQ